MLTINNPKLTFEAWAASIKADYLVGQLEKSESGTPHFQVVAYYKHPRHNSYWNGRACWSKGISKEDVAKCIAYVTKKETRVDGPFEYGVSPQHARKTRDWDKALGLAKQGRVLEIAGDVLVPYLQNLQKLAVLYQTPSVPTSLRGNWWYGPPGTGKSRTVFDLYPGAFRKA